MNVYYLILFLAYCSRFLQAFESKNEENKSPSFPVKKVRVKWQSPDMRETKLMEKSTSDPQPNILIDAPHHQLEAPCFFQIKTFNKSMTEQKKNENCIDNNTPVFGSKRYSRVGVGFLECMPDFVDTSKESGFLLEKLKKSQETFAKLDVADIDSIDEDSNSSHSSQSLKSGGSVPRQELEAVRRRESELKNAISSLSIDNIDYANVGSLPMQPSAELTREQTTDNVLSQMSISEEAGKFGSLQHNPQCNLINTPYVPNKTPMLISSIQSQPAVENSNNMSEKQLSMEKLYISAKQKRRSSINTKLIESRRDYFEKLRKSVALLPKLSDKFLIQYLEK